MKVFTLFLFTSAFAETPANALSAGERLNWKFSFAVPMPGLMVGIGALVLLLLTLLLYLKIWRAFPKRRAALLIFLRTLGLVALFLSSLQPIVSHDLVVPRKGELLVLFDTSKSMSIADMSPEFLPPAKEKTEDNQIRSRAQAAASSIKTVAWLEQLQRRFRLHLFEFGSHAAPVGLDALKAMEPRGEFTDIGASVSAAYKQVQGDIRAIVVVTDGADAARRPLSAVADEIGLPLFTVGVGDPSPEENSDSRELAIASVEYNKRVVVNERATIRVNVYHRGFEGEVPVEIKFGETILSTQLVSLNKEEKNTWVTLFIVPSTVGLFTYHVAIPQQKGEQTVTNNTRNITIEVHSDETRVLYIAGEPNYDYKFLKQVLREDPVFSFTGMVRFSPERVYRQGKWPEDQALDLKNYHVVILANVEDGFLENDQLELLRKQVDEEGTGVIVVGGHNVFSSKQKSPLDRALPVDVPPDAGTYKDSVYDISLTSEGANHPIFSFLSDLEKNLEFWASLPKSAGLNTGLVAKPGATVLAVAQIAPSPSAFAVVQSYGKGRSVVIAGRYIWPWRGNKAGASAYERFWGQALRWVANREQVRIKEGERLRFWLDKDDYNAGDEVRMEALLTDQSGKLTGTADMVANLSTPGNEQVPVNLESLDELGRYSASYVARESGQYEIELIARQDEFLLGTATSRFTVGSTLAELDQIQMNEPLLRSVAERTGGAYFAMRDIGKLPQAIPAGKQIELQRVSKEVWSHPYFLILFFALITTEWILRKKFHMV
ncbi:MAG: hypothetical protein O3B01_23610 [Planctomycetota bacterium]|nr:hypothetical protein [Planctomycetota bacterium]MDA1141559.1 hypothetical protein [Planctomycetota bacterium]